MRDLARRERRISNARLAVFLAGFVMAWLVFASGSLPLAALVLPAGVFLALVLVHDRVIEARKRGERAVRFYEDGEARLEDRFSGGAKGERFLDAAHPYAADLDLFGGGSVFELLCRARTSMGEETLAAWLLDPASPAIVAGRQAAVAELRPALDLREDVWLLGDDLRSELDARALRRWAEAPVLADLARLRLLAAAAGLGVPVTALLWAIGLLAGAPVLVALVLAVGVTLFLNGRVEAAVAAVERPARELALLQGLLVRIEQAPFTSPALVRLRGALAAEGEAASARIATLRKRLDLLDARRNQLFAPIALALLWGTQLGLAVEAWRARSGASLPAWLAAVGEFEALSSLASHAFERPEEVFPALVETGPRFEGEGLAHPLLPRRSAVPNDVVLGQAHRLLVVSGSNMSGKSTLLRTVGVAAVLAQTGSVVRATGLRLSPLSVGASIRAVDSLQEGTSRFYAEIRRLSTIVTLAGGSRPLLFLLDEVLAGTNSHDRRIGAEGVVRALHTRGAIGLVTTHDLALADIADAMAPAAANVHFEDHLESGRVSFDYRMRPGVVRKSNALELMRSVGLDV